MEVFSYKTYLTQILKYPLLTGEQEIELSKKIQAGDQQAKTQIVNANLRLVVSIAKKYENKTVSLMDLIQEGNIGLMTAAGKYHFSFNTRFSTYAYPWIAQFIARYLQSKVSLISLPVRKEELLHKIKKAQTTLYQELNHEPSDAEIAEYLGLKESEVNTIRSFSYAMTSIDTEIDPYSGHTLGDIIADTSSNPEKALMGEQTKGEVQRIIKNLSFKERMVILNRYDMSDSQDKKTLREVGSMLGVSAETVRQIEIRAMKKLHASVNEDSALFA